MLERLAVSFYPSITQKAIFSLLKPSVLPGLCIFADFSNQERTICAFSSILKYMENDLQ